MSRILPSWSRYLWFLPVLLVVAFIYQSLQPARPSHPFLIKLFDVMQNNMPPYDQGYLQEVTEQVCPIVDAEKLEAVVGLRVGDHEVTKGMLSAMSDLPANTAAWRFVRSAAFQWSQDLSVYISPDGTCYAHVIFRGPMA